MNHKPEFGWRSIDGLSVAVVSLIKGLFPGMVNGSGSSRRGTSQDPVPPLCGLSPW